MSARKIIGNSAELSWLELFIFGYMVLFAITTLIAIFWQALIYNGSHKHTVFFQSEITWMMVTSTAQFLGILAYLSFKRPRRP